MLVREQDKGVGEAWGCVQRNNHTPRKPKS